MNERLRPKVLYLEASCWTYLVTLASSMFTLPSSEMLSISRILAESSFSSAPSIMYVTVENQTDTVQKFTAYGAIPVYGRSADNIRDHRNVTSMLLRIETTEHGINVCPTMSFDERGHQPNHKIYYVNGCSGKGENPISYYPTVEDFIGEGGTYTHPRTVYEGYKGVPAHSMAAGKEAMGAFCFSSFTLAPGEKTDFILLSGIADSKEEIENIFEKYNTSDKVKNALEETRIYWKKQVNVDFHTQDPDFDSYMKWVSFQPFLRRLFGCSFLPHHDYGRGGRGWRDLWQDCLSLLLMNPQNVGAMIEKNYGGVRIDGTNATIIGDGDGNFIADRNGIARMSGSYVPIIHMITAPCISSSSFSRSLGRDAFKIASTAFPFCTFLCNLYKKYTKQPPPRHPRGGQRYR